jgi:hypothetical protein
MPVFTRQKDIAVAWLYANRQKTGGDNWISFFETAPRQIRGIELAPNTNLREFLHTNLMAIPPKRGVSSS